MLEHSALYGKPPLAHFVRNGHFLFEAIANHRTRNSDLSARSTQICAISACRVQLCAGLVGDRCYTDYSVWTSIIGTWTIGLEQLEQYEAHSVLFRLLMGARARRAVDTPRPRNQIYLKRRPNKGSSEGVIGEERATREQKKKKKS